MLYNSSNPKEATAVTIQQDMATYFEGQANWRSWKAEEYPNDDRNASSASALTQLAAYVLSLPDDDPTLVCYRTATDGYSTEFGSLGEESGRVGGRIGFDRGRFDPASELAWFVGAVELDRAEMDAAMEREEAWRQEAVDEANNDELLLDKMFLEHGTRVV